MQTFALREAGLTGGLHSRSELVRASVCQRQRAAVAPKHVELRVQSSWAHLEQVLITKLGPYEWSAASTSQEVFVRPHRGQRGHSSRSNPWAADSALCGQRAATQHVCARTELISAQLSLLCCIQIMRAPHTMTTDPTPDHSRGNGLSSQVLGNT